MVSVVIPTRNRWAQLAERGLRSALDQRSVEFELVVIDDGSESNPGDLPGLDDARVRLYRQPQQRGVAAARNIGIERSRGELIAFLDDDDIWSPWKLARLESAFKEGAPGFAYSGVLVVDAQLRPLKKYSPPQSATLATELTRGNVLFAGASNVIVRRELLERAGGFDEAFSAGADWEMWLRLAKLGSATAVDEPLLAYRPTAWAVEDELAHREDCERLAEKHPDVMIDWVRYERWLAEAYSLQGCRWEAARRYFSIARRFRSPGTSVHAARVLAEGPALNGLRRLRAGRAPAWLQSYDLSRSAA